MHPSCANYATFSCLIKAKILVKHQTQNQK